jgi:hypothetical protein
MFSGVQEIELHRRRRERRSEDEQRVLDTTRAVCRATNVCGGLADERSVLAVAHHHSVASATEACDGRTELAFVFDVRGWRALRETPMERLSLRHGRGTLRSSPTIRAWRWQGQLALRGASVAGTPPQQDRGASRSSLAECTFRKGLRSSSS